MKMMDMLKEIIGSKFEGSCTTDERNDYLIYVSRGRVRAAVVIMADGRIKVRDDTSMRNGNMMFIHPNDPDFIYKFEDALADVLGVINVFWPRQEW
jgi:hypothetical protein